MEHLTILSLRLTLVLWFTGVVGVWVAGTVLAKGVWSTLCAVIFPPWAWYLVVERIMAATGWL